MRAARREGMNGSKPKGRKYDLVVAAYSLSELPTHASRAAATALLWGMVSEGGVLVLVENGSAMGSHTVRSAREMILNSVCPCMQPFLTPKQPVKGGEHGDEQRQLCSQKGQGPGATVVGPCQHDKECPLRPELRETCQFSHKVPKNMVKVNGPSRQEVFSYVTLLKQKASDINMQQDGTLSTVDILKEVLTSGERQEQGVIEKAIEALGSEGSSIFDERLRREDWGRLIRKPIKGQRHVLLDVCSPDGKIERQIVSKGKLKKVPGMYVAARKSQLGGLWPHVHHLLKGGVVKGRSARSRGGQEHVSTMGVVDNDAFGQGQVARGGDGMGKMSES
ncbi:unnamed protein product [Choristocarpus tenellus]